jgi:hypothetical protein
MSLVKVGGIKGTGMLAINDTKQGCLAVQLNV